MKWGLDENEEGDSREWRGGGGGSRRGRRKMKRGKEGEKGRSRWRTQIGGRMMIKRGFRMRMNRGAVGG